MISTTSVKGRTVFFRRSSVSWGLVSFFALLSFSASAQMGGYGRGKGGQVMSDGSAVAIAQREASAKQYQAQLAQAAAQQAALQRIFARDPWRIINGTTNRAGGPG